MVEGMTCLLAVDSGGTKCEAILATSQGAILGYGRTDLSTSEIRSDYRGLGRADETILATLRKVVNPNLRVDELHFCGVRPGLLESLSEWSCPIICHSIREQDGPMALASVPHGILALAGTGAFAYGRAPSGDELLLDGIGPLYGDHGGAFQIGLAGVRASGRSRWHSQFKTELEHEIPKACRAILGEPDTFSMVEFMLMPHDRSVIASLAKVVNDLASSGDLISHRILLEAADDMVETILCVARSLWFADTASTLVGAGSVIVHSNIYWERICDRMRQELPNFEPKRVMEPQVMGLLRAMATQMNIDAKIFRPLLQRQTLPKLAHE